MCRHSPKPISPTLYSPTLTPDHHLLLLLLHLPLVLLPHPLKSPLPLVVEWHPALLLNRSQNPPVMLGVTCCKPSDKASTCGKWRHSGSRRRGITSATTWLPSCRVVSLWSAATARMTLQSLMMMNGLNDSCPGFTFTTTFVSFLSFKHQSFTIQITF